MHHLYTQSFELLPLLIAGIVLFVVELLYFRIADHFSIIDKPNSRSSHSGIVIRGGGVIFFVALLGWFFYTYGNWPYFMLGATMVAIISFMDDIKPRNSGWRFGVQVVAVLLLFYSIDVYDWPIWLSVVACIICIGALNAFNFMDGINGITGVYALVNLITFGYVQYVVAPFTEINLIAIMLVAVLIFLYFNFRAKARCFAGDVGSVTIAFIQIFLLLQLIVATDNFLWVLIFLVYGIDSVITILYRLKRKENIFRPHRTHLYQYLSNELKMPHRFVSILYGVVQLALNALVVFSFKQNWFIPPVAMAVLVLVLYLATRYYSVNKITRAQMDRNNLQA